MVSLLAVKLGRDVRRQWLQFAGVALTLALGVAVFGAAFDSYDNLKTSYREIYDRLRFADVTISGGDTPAIAAAARETPGVDAVRVRREADVPFRIGSGADEHTLLGRVIAQPFTRSRVNAVLVQDGTGVGAARPDGVVVERHMADHFRLGVGDHIDVFVRGWRTLDVVGIAVSPEYLWPARDRQDLLTSPDDFGVVFAPESLVDALPPQAVTTQVLVRYTAGTTRSALDGRMRILGRRHGAADVMVRADQPSNGALQQDVDAFAQLAVLFPLLFLVAGGLAAYVLLGRLVRSQRSQIGMLAANGYPRNRLLAHYVAFGGVAGAVGAGLGALGGLGLAMWLTRTYTSSLGIPLAVSRFHPLTPIVGLALGTVAGVAAATMPARAAIRVAPAEAMRGTAPTGVAHRSAVERLPGIRGLPLRARLALRNLRRSPRRTVSTSMGVVLAAVLVLSSLGMLDTISLVLDDQFHEVQRQDAQLYLAGRPDAQQRAVVAGTRGVRASEVALEAPIVLTARSRRYETVLTGFETGTAMHRFPNGLPADGVVLGRGLHTMLGVDAGDDVDVAVGDAPPVPVRVAGFVDEPLGSVAYAALPVAERLAGSRGLYSVLVRYVDGASRETMRRRLSTIPGSVAFRDVKGSEETVRKLLGLFYAIVGVMLLFGSILAFVVLFNTLAVNLSERTVELATLRAAGGRLATLARMLTGETLLLVLVTIPFGLAAGWVTARWLMSSFNSDLYHFALRLRPTTPVLLALALLGVAALTHVPARRTLARLDVARVVRERAL